MGVCMARGARGGDHASPEDEVCACTSGHVGFMGPGIVCARSGKASEEIGTWKRTFRVPGRTTCAKPGECRRRRGGWNKILVAPKVSKKLELMRGAEPHLPCTREWFWGRGAKSHGSRDITVLGARSCSVCNFPFPWPPAGACAGGGRTGAGQPQPSGPAGWGEGDGLEAWALRTDPEVEENQPGLAVLPADTRSTERKPT